MSADSTSPNEPEPAELVGEATDELTSGAGDEILIAELRRAVARFDPPPADLAALGQSLLSWRDPSAELAALVADSRELSGAVRDGGDQVLLRFDAAGVAITLEAIPDGSGSYSLLGQLEPGEPGTIEVRRPERAAAPTGGPIDEDGTSSLEAPVQLGASPPRSVSAASTDEFGRFGPLALTAGWLSLRFTPADPSRSAVDTSWVVIGA